jgi:hypothetical protein
MVVINEHSYSLRNFQNFKFASTSGNKYVVYLSENKVLFFYTYVDFKKFVEEAIKKNMYPHRLSELGMQKNVPVAAFGFSNGIVTVNRASSNTINYVTKIFEIEDPHKNKNVVFKQIENI